jgi:hypothetical protein
LMAVAKPDAVKLSTGTGRAAAPIANSRSDQNRESNMNGTQTEGIPAHRALQRTEHTPDMNVRASSTFRFGGCCRYEQTRSNAAASPKEGGSEQRKCCRFPSSQIRGLCSRQLDTRGVALCPVVKGSTMMPASAVNSGSELEAFVEAMQRRPQSWCQLWCGGQKPVQHRWLRQ